VTANSEIRQFPLDEEPDLPEEDHEEIDLDLDAIDEELRDERVGHATTVKAGGTVLHIMHSGDWPSSAMRAASMGDWDTWAQGVIEDSREYDAWLKADLRNYQIEEIFRKCSQAARMNSGKSQKRTGSRRTSRRK